MNRRTIVLAGAVTAVGVFALATIGFAAAQDPGHGNSGVGMHGSMASHEQMGNHNGMAGQMGAMEGMEGCDDTQHAAAHEALATALGMTVTDLDTQLAAGRTIAEIAAEKGVDLTAIHESMSETHTAGHGSGMDHAAMHGTD